MFQDGCFLLKRVQSTCPAFPAGSTKEESDETIRKSLRDSRSVGMGRSDTHHRNLFSDFPPYGEHFLLTISSVYPGYHASGSFLDVLAGTGYGLIDGGICGCIFAWLYNLCAGRMGQSA